MNQMTHLIFEYLENRITQAEAIRRLKRLRYNKIALQELCQTLHMDESRRIKKYILPEI
jgi:hypothetical protein